MGVLYSAARAGKARLAAFLIKNGADRRREDKTKRTPYDVALSWHPKNKELLKVLDFPGRKPPPAPSKSKP